MTYFQQVKEEFHKYLSAYDQENDKIKLKLIHTFCVVTCSENICRRKGLSEEETDLAKIIAVLHDIGRFEQLKRFNSFESDTMDHAAYGVEILFEKGLIRRFLPESFRDSIIRDAIAYHSDFELPTIPDERVLLHAKLIRDADKLDNCRVKLADSIETLLDTTAKHLGSCSISPSVANAFFHRRCILSSDRQTPMDYWVSYVAYFYDINFKETLEIVWEKQYVSRIIGRIDYTNPETSKLMGKMEQFMLKEIQCRLSQ